jgi:hypothetical protein
MNTALPFLEGHLLLSIDSSTRSCLKKYLRQLIVGCFTTSFYASLVILVCFVALRCCIRREQRLICPTFCGIMPDRTLTTPKHFLHWPSQALSWTRSHADLQYVGIHYGPLKYTAAAFFSSKRPRVDVA